MDVWHYELNQTPSGYYTMTMRPGPAPWRNPKNKGYWIFVKTIGGGHGKKWIPGEKPYFIKIKEAISIKRIFFKEKIIY
jgi:hypothetical protein